MNTTIPLAVIVIFAVVVSCTTTDRGRGKLDVNALVTAEESSYLPFQITENDIQEVVRWYGVNRLSVKKYTIDLDTTPRIPDKVSYIHVPREKNEKTIADFIRYLKDPVANGYLQNTSVFICGPHLSVMLKRSGLLDNLEFTKVIGPLTVGGKQEVLIEYVFKGDSIAKVLGLVRNLILRDDSFLVRRFSTRELSWYWSIIAYDVEEPIFMFENRYHKVGIDFAKDGKLFFLDLFEKLEW
ncbi:MAG TPA: hypothetical protein ENN69_06955 [Spirochaetia bacterium]|nr:hypothetical protein [Spirochaetia bacterium]